MEPLPPSPIKLFDTDETSEGTGGASVEKVLIRHAENVEVEASKVIEDASAVAEDASKLVEEVAEKASKVVDEVTEDASKLVEEVAEKASKVVEDVSRVAEELSKVVEEVKISSCWAISWSSLWNRFRSLPAKSKVLSKEPPAE